MNGYDTRTLAVADGGRILLANMGKKKAGGYSTAAPGTRFPTQSLATFWGVLHSQIPGRESTDWRPRRGWAPREDRVNQLPPGVSYLRNPFRRGHLDEDLLQPLLHPRDHRLDVSGALIGSSPSEQEALRRGLVERLVPVVRTEIGDGGRRLCLGPYLKPLAMPAGKGQFSGNRYQTSTIWDFAMCSSILPSSPTFRTGSRNAMAQYERGCSARTQAGRATLASSLMTAISRSGCSAFRRSSARAFGLLLR